MAASALLVGGAVVGADAASVGTTGPLVQVSVPRSLVAEALTAASFADPSDVVRPQFRYWVPTPPPAGGLKDEVIRSDIADMEALGAGGVELAALGYFGGGPNRSEAWGSETWARSVNTVLGAALDSGLEVSATIGPGWPARIPTVDTPNDPRASKGLYESSTVVAPGSPAVAAPLPAPTGYTAGAVPTLVALVAAQCSASATCAPTTNPGAAGAARTTVLDRSTARRVAVTRAGDPASELDDTFSFTPPAGTSSNGWAVMAFWQATESDAQSGYAGPMYLVDHLSKEGASVITDFWDQNILDYGSGPTSTQALIDDLGGIQLFEDSLELSDRLKWTDTMLSEWTARRGYDPTLSLPALANTGAQACNSFTPTQSGANNTAAGTGSDCGVPPVFDFSDGSGASVRRDYRQTFSDMYIANRLGTLTAWGDAHNIRIKTQSYGEPIDMAAAATAVDVPEGESLAFSNNPEYYKVVAVGAHMSGSNAVSTECCAAFRTPYGIDLKTRLGFVNRAYAGGVNVNTWHGYSYEYAGNGSQAWPGQHAFGTFVDEAYGKRNPNATAFGETQDQLARQQLVLRQGSPRFDVAVYREDLGLRSTQGNGNNIGESQGGTFNEGTVDAPDTVPGTATVAVKTRMNELGYTYEYLSPEHLDLPTARWDGSRLFPDRSAYKAMVLNNQSTSMRPDALQRVVALAEQGMPLVIIGGLPSTSPSAGDQAAQSSLVARASARLRAMVDDGVHRVTRVGSEAYVPSALTSLGVRASARPETPSPALLPVRRHSATGDFYYLFNQSGTPVRESVTLEGAGQPYRLDALTGSITPVPVFQQGDGTVSFEISLDSQQAGLYAVAPTGIPGVQAPSVRALSTTAREAVTTDRGQLAVRTGAAGTVTTILGDRRSVVTPVTSPGTVTLSPVWDLSVESWTPDASTPDTTDTARTLLPTRQVTAAADGTLPSWRDIVGVGVGVAGIGTYTQTFTASEGWRTGAGAYLDLGAASDTVEVRVNGQPVPVDQAEPGSVDIGPWMVPGANRLEVVVASRLLNAVRTAGSSGFTSAAYTDNGLFGPVRATAYRQTVVDTSAAPTTPPVTDQRRATVTELVAKRSTQRFRSGPRAVLKVQVTPAPGLGSTVAITRRGRVLGTVELNAAGRATYRLPRSLKPGRHVVKAVFSGDARSLGSTSGTVVIRVKARRPRS
ncbi:glycosyl hydrolase [Nocardioides flavescens]|uniref:Bacterial Ig-like domain-containing protein n=1 Tax=Nocardioides flavescens TaxID=2691959 RepID=A0A6L7EWY4_9ACTN|nr:hypothetical protein [Nocardioides flavescens]